MSNCINYKHPDVAKIAGELNISPVVAAAKIGVWQSKNNIEDRFPTVDELQSSNEVNQTLKAVDILQSDKAKQVFDKGKKANWDLNKILTELQVPKDQKQLILDLGITDREQIALELASNYSYTVEVNTTKESIRSGYKKVEDDNYDSLYSPSENKYYNYSEEMGWMQSDENNKNQEFDINPPEDAKPYLKNERFEDNYVDIDTSYYSNLTVPGGTNYTENEIATPLITPSIKGHAQFATDNGIGWFRSDNKAPISLNSVQVKNNFTTADINEIGIAEAVANKTSINRVEEQSTIQEFNKAKENGVLQKEDSFIKEYLYKDYVYSSFDSPIDDISYVKYKVINVDNSKTRRILEVQSDLFQKGRDKEWLSREMDSLTPEEVANEPEWLRPIGTIVKSDRKKNAFLNLLIKDSNWVTFFVKSIIQDSAKKGYEKVLFPTGNTASKVEGHTTLEEFKKQKEDRIKELEAKEANPWKGRAKEVNGRYIIKEFYKDKWVEMLDGKTYTTQEIAEREIDRLEKASDYSIEINQLKEELKRIETEGFGALKPIYNFYENTVTNILNKNYGKENVKVITDEYDNTWNEITIENKRDESTILLNKKDLSEFESDENESIFSESVKEPVKVKEDNFEVNKKLLFGNEKDTTKSFTAKEVLQNIIDFDLNLSDAGTNLVFKAMNILNLAKTRVKIISQERFDKLTQGSEGNGTAVMAYNYDAGNVIYMTENSLKMFNKEQILESFIHEVAHNLSIKALINPVTFEEHEFHDLIFKAFEQYKYLGKTLNGSGSYGFTNEKEFVAELYSNAEFRKEIQNLDKGFWKKFKDAIRRLFGLPKSLINDDLIDSILLIESVEKFIESNTTADENVFKNDYSKSFNSVLFKKIKDIKDADTYELETIDKKAEHLVNKAKSKVAELINRTKKSDKEKAGEFLEEFRKLEKELETLSSLNKWKAITGYMVSFKSAIDKLNNDLENKFKVKEVTFNGVKYTKVKILDGFKSENGEYIIPEDQKSKVDKDFFDKNNFIINSNLYNDIENEGIKSFSNKDYLSLANDYDDYLASYDLLEEVKRLIGDTVKDHTLSREDKLEIKQIKEIINEISKPHDKLIARIKDLRKDSAIKLFADPSNNKKVIAKWRNKLSLEYNKLTDPKESRDEWIGYHMANTHSEEIKKDLENAARKIIENPYTDISSYVKNWMDLLNTNSPLINMIANIVGKMRDSILKEITNINFKIDSVFQEYSKFNDSLSMSKKYGNLVELNESEDRYYLKGKYSIKFKEEYNKMLSKIKDEIYSKYKPFAVQYFNLSSVNNNEKTISLRKTGSHDVIENEELMISVNGIRTGTIVKVNNIVTFSEFSKLSDSRKDDFARAIGNYKNYEDFLKSNDYAKKDSKKSLEHPEVYNFINGNESMDIISYTKEKDSKEDYEKFKEKNKIYKDWIKENTTKDESGKTIPHSKYLNKPLNPTEEKALDFFRTQTKSNHELNYKGRGGLYSTFFGAEYYKLPSKTKSDGERALEGDIKGQIKDKWTDLKETKVDDIHYGEAFDSKGGELKRVKINFRGKLESKNQSLDLFTVYRAEETNAISFKHRSANENKLKLFLDIAKNKDYKTKSLSTSKWALNLFAKKGVQGQTFSGEQSNEYAKIKGILETALYDITSYSEVKLAGMDVNKITAKINGAAAFIGMTLNIGSGAVNFLNGQTMMIMLRIGGNYINKSNLSKAELNYTANLPKIMADISNPVKKSFHNQMLNMFDIIGGMNINKQDFLNNSTVKEMLSLHNTNFTNEIIEHGLNCVLTEAVLRSIPVMNKNHKYIDKEGNEVSEDKAASIFDMLYLDKDGILKTKEYFTYSKYNLVDDYHTTGKQSINYFLKKNVENLYGVYDNNMKAEIAKNWYGKLLMMFKSFFLSQMEYRYKGLRTANKAKDELDDEDLTFNNAEQEFTEGIYVTAIRTFYPLLRHLNLQMTKENFKNLSDYEKANLRQVFFEVSLTAILLPLLGAIMAANAGDDDDELYFLLFAFRRLESEMSQFRNIAELNRMISNPIAANRFLQNGFTVVNDIFSPINFNPQKNESYFDWLSENSKNENILLNHAFKLAPGKTLFMNTYKQRYSLIDK